MNWNPFKRRVKGIYDPQKPKMEITFISVTSVAVASIIGIWILSYLFGNWMGLSPIGPVLMVILFATIIILSVLFVKKRAEGTEVSNKDFYLILLLVVLLVLGFLFLPDIAPEYYQNALMSIRANGLQAFLP